MAYTPQTWADNAPAPNGVFNAERGNYMEAGIQGAFARADDAYALASSISGGTGGNPVLTVASNECSTAIKNLCTYVCDGVDDQVQINQALQAASRANDGFGGTGLGVVVLVGPRFYVANNNTTCITMYPSTHLTGSGWNTIITPMWSSTTVNRGAIELLNADVAHCRVSDLAIGRHNAVQSNGHGIYFVNNASADQYELKTGSDPYIQIDNVLANYMSRSGFYYTGTTGGAREMQISHCLAWTCLERGFYIDGSDGQISDCRATGGGNFPRFEISGGNTKIANCKAYFSGNRAGDSGATADGFVISSTRVNISNCDAQDCGRWGFRFTGADVTASGCVADSNSRATASGGGFEVGVKGCYSGMSAYNRPQTPASPQQIAVSFTGAPQVFFEGRTGIESTNAGAVHVQGSPGADSYVRIVRQGTTLYSVG